MPVSAANHRGPSADSVGLYNSVHMAAKPVDIKPSNVITLGAIHRGTKLLTQY